MSVTVDVSDSLDEARTRLLRTARALNGAWAALLCSMAALVVASGLLLLVAISVRPVYVVIWSVIVAATVSNLSRFWPRRAPRAGLLLGRREVAALRTVLDPEATLPWPDVVRLVPQPEVELAEGELGLGLPLLACLSRTEMRELLHLAALQAEVEGVLSVRWALRIAHGRVGRPLVLRRARPQRSSLAASVRNRSAALEADLGNWAGACERVAVAASRSMAAAHAARAQVVDAWSLMQTEWLEPAALRGRRHVAPYTGLRHFLEGADTAGWLDRPPPWWPPSGAVAETVGRHEEAVALELGPRGDELPPITWAEHPREVTLPHWRALVAEVLDTARRDLRDDAVTLDSVFRFMEGSESVVQRYAEKAGRVLTAAICVAAVDSGRFRPAWKWPEGTQLEDEGTRTLPVQSIVSEVLGMVRERGDLAAAFTELRAALVELGLDLDEPLWLDHDPLLRPERPVGSFTARAFVGARLVVLTDRTLHVFRDPDGPRLEQFLRRTPRDAATGLRNRMLTVWQGETTDQVLALPAALVRRARIGPATGGLWWRLTLDCDGRTVVLRGRGDGRAEEVRVREWLDREVERPWLDASPGARRLRNALGLLGVVLGSLALAAGVVLTLLTPDGMASALPPALAIGGFGALVLAFLPDALLELTQRQRLPAALPD